jgi:hypothetical protein
MNGRESAVVSTPPENSMFTDLRNTLEKLFSEQLEVRQKRIEADETAEKLSETIAKKAADLNRKQPEGELPQIRKPNIDVSLNEARVALEKLEAQRKKAMNSKALFLRQIADLDDKIKGIQQVCRKLNERISHKILILRLYIKQTLPRSLDKRSRQLLELMIKCHFMETDSMRLHMYFCLHVLIACIDLDLDTSCCQTTTNLKRKELELHSLYTQLALYEKITTFQRDLLRKADVSEPDKLFGLYDELQRLLRDDDRKVRNSKPRNIRWEESVEQEDNGKRSKKTG